MSVDDMIPPESMVFIGDGDFRAIGDILVKWTPFPGQLGMLH